MAAKHKASKRSGIGDREQTVPGVKGDLTGVHANAALIPLILRNARDLIAFLDTEGRRIYSSPSYGPLLGDPEKLVGSDSFDDVHLEDRERVRRIFRDTVRTGAGYRTEYRLLGRDGTARVVQSEGSAIRDEEDRVAGVVVVGRDITEERDAERRAREADERYRNYIERSSEAIYRFENREPVPVDLPVPAQVARIIETACLAESNLVHARLYGYASEHDTRGKPIVAFGGREANVHLIEAFVSGGYRIDNAEWSEQVAGEQRWFRGSVVGTVENGLLTGAWGTQADITQRRRAEEALRAQTERLRVGQATARLIVMDWDIPNDHLQWSDSPEWLRGPLPPSGRYPLYKDQVHPEDLEKFLRMRASTIESLQDNSLEYRIVRTDAEVLWVESRHKVFTDTAGKAMRMLVAIHDITEHKHAEQALAESEARFRSLAELSSEWYWEQDAELRFRSVSEVFFHKSGMSREEVLGKRRWELAGGSPLNTTWDAHRALLEARRPFRDFEYVRVADDGSRQFVSLSGEPVFDAEGRFTGYRGTGRDVTARLHTEQELLARKEGDRVLIELGLLGLREQDPRALLESAVQVIARTLEVELATALELLPDRSGLRVVAGTGWKPSAVGQVIVGADIDSQAGYTIRQYELARGRSGEKFAPVVVADLASETRFRAPPPLLGYGVVSGVTVVIPGAERPWGVLGVHSRTPRRFEPREAEFLQAAANLLSAALERCRTHAALRESEARFRALTELSSDWYWEQDSELRFSFLSEEFFRTSDMLKEEILGKRRWELPRTTLSNVSMEAHRATLEAHRPFRELELLHVGADGRRQYFSASGEPYYDAHGDFQGYRGVGSDITKKKEAEAALRESESRFRSLTELSSDWYWEQDDQFRFTTLSGPGAAAMSRGGDPSVYLGKARWEIADLEHMEGDWSQHRAQLELHEPFRDLILRRRMNDGALRYMSVSGEPVFDETGDCKGYRGVARDVTDKVVLERSLRESEQRFLSFMDNVPANAFIKDSQLRYTWINRAHELHRHGGLHDVLGCDDFQLRPPEVARALRQQDEEVLRAKGPAWFVNRIPIMDGGASHILVVKFPLPDASGAPGVAGIGIDISEQYKLEQTVRQLLRRLVHAQEAERRKVAGDLHDLIGQKLTALSLGLDILRQRIPDAAGAPLTPRLQQMSALLEETIAAVRNVMSELRPPMLDDHGLLPALHWYASLFEARTALRVRVAGPELGPRLDREIEIALFRIAQEALTNAAKHSGGSRVRIQVERSAEHVRMCIEDDGRGFDEQALERATKTTSWGMSAMRERAHAFGGQLRVESRAPGAAIVVDVPLEHAD